MKYRQAFLFADYRKKGSPIANVTVLCIGAVDNEDGSYIAASVEKANGEIIEVSHNRLKFIT